MMTTETEKTKDYTVLLYQIKRNGEFLSSSPATHCLFCRSLQAKETLVKHTSPGRTILVDGIPPFLSRDHLKGLFSQLAKVANVNVFSRKTSCLRSAYVLFSFRKLNKTRKALGGVDDLANLLDCISDKVYTVELTSKDLFSVDVFLDDYFDAFKEPDVVVDKVNEFMKKYDEKKRQAEEEEQKEALKQVEEGWTLVTSKRGYGKNKVLKRRMAAGSGIRDDGSSRKRRKKHGTGLAPEKNLSRVQVKESRDVAIKELRRKFEENKQRVNEWKLRRKFKPY